MNALILAAALLGCDGYAVQQVVVEPVVEYVSAPIVRQRVVVRQPILRQRVVVEKQVVRQPIIRRQVVRQRVVVGY